jgi:ABC-2 type transport system ATP-binding protein
MRMLSCYMPATSGTARVAGFDIFTSSDDVRRNIGYMPENNPLHMDMRVREYLKFRARLKGLGIGRSRERVDTVTEQCGLTDVSRKLIGQLSKGYRQRVGLADALVHEPKLLILDEPTNGLDPHQIRSVRQLIKDLGKTHTVLLSTHILDEVEKTCTRVLIIHEGKIRAADSLENIHHSSGTHVIAEISAPLADLELCFEQFAEIEDYDISPAEGDYHRCSLAPRPGLDLRPMVFDYVAKRGWKLRELSRSRRTLEDIFVQVTRADKEEGS